MLFSFFGPRSYASSKPSSADRIRLCGRFKNEREFSIEDLRALPAEFHIADASRFALGVRGEAVRLAGLLAAADARPDPLYINVGTRDGKTRFALFRRQIGPLALIVYARDGRPLAAEHGGPFRLVLPGFHDAARDVPDLGWIELAKNPGPDARDGEKHIQLVVGDQAFDLEGTWRDPRRDDTFIIPPPNSSLR